MENLEGCTTLYLRETYEKSKQDELLELIRREKNKKNINWPITVTLPEYLKERVIKFCESHNLTPSKLIYLLLIQYFGDDPRYS